MGKGGKMSETMDFGFGWILDGMILVTVVTPDLVTVDGPDGKTARLEYVERGGMIGSRPDCRPL